MLRTLLVAKKIKYLVILLDNIKGQEFLKIVNVFN